MRSNNNQRPFMDGTAASDNAGLLNNDDSFSQFMNDPANYVVDFALDPSILDPAPADSQHAQGSSQSHSAAAVQQPPRPDTPSQFFDEAYQPQVVSNPEYATAANVPELGPADNAPAVLNAALPATSPQNNNTQAFYPAPSDAEVSPEISAAASTAYPPVGDVLASVNSPYPGASAVGNAGTQLASVNNIRGNGMDNVGQTQAFNGLGGLGIPNSAGNWQQGWNVNNGQPHQTQVLQGNGGPSNQYSNIRPHQAQVPQGNSVPSGQCYIPARMPQRYVNTPQMIQNSGGPSLQASRQFRNEPAPPVRASGHDLDYEAPVKVSHKRRDKGNDKANADRVYLDQVPVPTNWTAELPGGMKSHFSYSPEGPFRPNKILTTEELQAYFDQCPRLPLLWVQQCPSQSNHRTRKEDRQCRWAECPVPARTINSGWLRVAFDEYPQLTSNGTKDPFHMAGSMHLWCFEQCFDPLRFHEQDRLYLDRRELLKEEKNPMSVSRDTDNAILRDWQTWKNRQERRERLFGPVTLPRPHDESLSHCLVNHHLRNQPDARRQVREARNVKRAVAFRKTADVHMGNLRFFVDQNNEEKNRKRRGKAAAATGQKTTEVYTDSSAIADVIVCAKRVPQDPLANSNVNLLPLIQHMNAPADQSPVQFAPEAIPAKRGQKRPRNDAEHDDPSSGDIDDNHDDLDSLFGSPRSPKRARIEEGEGGRRRFERTMDRPRRRLHRRRSYCCGDEPSRFRRGSLRLKL
ncbi:hypothetical protein EDB81DRAFT_851072 [Dactylonectria macrodidyma]|uniref:Uncharacterized protein n=1 Tax=Dactylonectria macrodidyma TaxID=307937 RepID=A0A9P9FMR2_9HYPO|nr:hypothetical protein EDB81DRAFT_851072 [Dactylonectria macrodidyma]